MRPVKKGRQQLQKERSGSLRCSKRYRFPYRTVTAVILGAVLLVGCQSGADTDRNQTEETESLTSPVKGETTAFSAEDEAGTAGGESVADTLDAALDTNTSEADYILPFSNSQFLRWEDVKELTSKELRIARNEIYARHKRRFKAQDLQTYFDSKSWYEGTIQPENFREELLNDYEKENVRYLKELEPAAGLEELSQAPSKEIIDRYGYENGHSALSFSLKPGTVKDCGSYYQVDAVYCQGIEAPGDLKYEDTVTLVFNELTGEKKTLVYRQGGLYEKEDALNTGPYYYTPTEDKSPVVLYQDSDDRVDKPVYEGQLYVRKDAASEIHIEKYSEPITFEKLNGEYEWYNGVFFDEKGYAVRLVVYGD